MDLHHGAPSQNCGGPAVTGTERNENGQEIVLDVAETQHAEGNGGDARLLRRPPESDGTESGCTDWLDASILGVPSDPEAGDMLDRAGAPLNAYKAAPWRKAVVCAGRPALLLLSRCDRRGVLKCWRLRRAPYDGATVGILPVILLAKLRPAAFPPDLRGFETGAARLEVAHLQLEDNA